jgi:hypothetical protein
MILVFSGSGIGDSAARWIYSFQPPACGLLPDGCILIYEKKPSGGVTCFTPTQTNFVKPHPCRCPLRRLASVHGSRQPGEMCLRSQAPSPPARNLSKAAAVAVFRLPWSGIELAAMRYERRSAQSRVARQAQGVGAISEAHDGLIAGIESGLLEFYRQRLAAGATAVGSATEEQAAP